MPPRDLYLPGSPYHVARRKYAEAAVQCVKSAIDLFGQPHSLLDVGCGEGALVRWSQDIGIDACGVDLAVPPVAPVGFYAWDLRYPLDLHRRFEWVLCWEVAEHLPPEAAETLCDSLIRHLERPRGRLLFTAAGPGQRGPGHLHLMPPEYWRWLFADRGLVWVEQESARLAKDWRIAAASAPWYAKNVGVYAWA